MDHTQRNSDILQRSDAWLTKSLPEMIAMRRDLHSHPEPAGAEFRTNAIVCEHMEMAGLAPQLRSDATGIIVDIDLVESDAPRIAIRADMDCVEVPDEKNVPWRSNVEGCCHACGHA